MRKTNILKCSSIRFKHFSNKGYALFACLGKEVLIGTLSIATISHAKADTVSINAEAASDSLQRKELKLDEVIVTGSRAPLSQSEAAKIVSVITRDDIHRSSAETVNDVLKLATGVDVRQRGGFGVQTDISVRGGNFDHVTILLNGVNISSPHTGHLSADFPVSPDDIERIEIIEGAAARVYGTAAFNGVINIITKDSTPSQQTEGTSIHGMVGAEGGSYGYLATNGRATLTTGALTNSISAGYSRSDGATSNSAFSSTRLFYQGHYAARNISVSGQVGYSYKPFEANTFYGASSTDQWESNERIMAAINGDIVLGKVHLSPQLYFNRWYDHYQWHKDSPAGENYHRVESKGIALNAWTAWALGRTSVGVEVRDERIRSTKLGLLLPETDWQTTGGHDADDSKFYKYRDQRCNASLFLEHDILLKQWTFSLGLMANMNDALDSKWRLYPGIDISYRPNDSWKLYASWNMALRMPTFTDLYYSGTGIEGNSNLKPEKSTDFQIGARYTRSGFIAEAQLFYSHKTDMIDWVKYQTLDASGNMQCDGIFHSLNFQMNNAGGEISMQLLPQEIWGKTCPLRKISVQYSYISEDSKYDVDVVSSKYAMDYLRHKVVITADSRIWSKLNLGMDWQWQERTGKGNLPYALLNGKLSWDAKRYSLFVNATNILNKSYYDWTYIKQPGFCIMGGAKLRF